MALIRNAAERGQVRTFGFRAFHKGLQKLVHVHEANFDSLDNEAVVSLPGKSGFYPQEFPVSAFRTPMRDLVLLEDTSRRDKNNNQIYEGDRIRARVQNEYGSWENVEGVVLFDEGKWGFSVNFENGSGLPLTGVVDEVEIVGNIFEHAIQSLQGRSQEAKTPHPE